MALHNSLSSENDQLIARYLSGDNQVWDTLKQAISDSSGFKRWQIERNSEKQLQGLSLDTLVHKYLRETLETLAY
jgi:hypothetical protein